LATAICNTQAGTYIFRNVCADFTLSFFNAIGAEEESTKRKTKGKKSTGTMAVLTAASSQI
jgi:hypothetical protein